MDKLTKKQTFEWSKYLAESIYSFKLCHWALDQIQMLKRTEIQMSELKNASYINFLADRRTKGFVSSPLDGNLNFNGHTSRTELFELAMCFSTDFSFVLSHILYSETHDLGLKTCQRVKHPCRCSRLKIAILDQFHYIGGVGLVLWNKLVKNTKLSYCQSNF